MPILESAKNVVKTPGESKFGGIKNKMYWVRKSLLSECPHLTPIGDRTTIDQSKFLTGTFAFKENTDKFNSFEFDVNNGKLEWKSVGENPSALLMELNFEMTISTLDASLYNFVEANINEDLILVLERANCSGERFMFGGCCLPATITAVEGGLGVDAKSFGGTKFTFLAYSNGLPPQLPALLTLPVHGEEAPGGGGGG